MRTSIAILALALVWALPARATELFYPGTFDPFHATHYQEVLAEIKKDPNAKVKILPIEDAVYNRQFGVARPLFFPYDEKLEILKETFRDYPNVEISSSLRKIDKNVLQTILEAVSKSPDPDKRVLIGTDVLDLWKDLPGFAKLTSKVTLVVDADVKNGELDAALAKKFAGNPHIRFVRNDGEGIRSSLVKKLLVSGKTDEAFAMLPPAYREHYSDPKQLAGLVENFHGRQLDWENQLLRKKLLPVLRESGVDSAALKEIAKNPRLEEELFLLDPSDEAAIQRYSAQVDAFLDDGIKQDKLTKQLTKAFSSKGYKEAFPSQHMSYVKYLFADYHPKADLPPSALKPPGVLYHWTNQWKLEHMDAYNPDKARVPLRYVRSAHFVATEHPELRGLPGLYAWTNPVTGMAADKSEVYAKPDSGNPPRLLVMKPKPDAKVIEITTHVDDLHPVATPNLGQYDLVLNRAYDKDGKLVYSEWIVLKPEAIESFSADPHAAEAVMRAELAKLEMPGFEYKPDELFNQQFTDKDFWIKRTKDFLKRSSARDIPEPLKRPMTGLDCERAYERLAR